MLTLSRETVLIKPAKTHPGVIVQSVAARDKQRATEYAKLHNIPQVHDSYEGSSPPPFPSI
jgi:predicted dehydrogenase